MRSISTLDLSCKEKQHFEIFRQFLSKNQSDLTYFEDVALFKLLKIFYLNALTIRSWYEDHCFEHYLASRPEVALGHFTSPVSSSLFYSNLLNFTFSELYDRAMECFAKDKLRVYLFLSRFVDFDFANYMCFNFDSNMGIYEFMHCYPVNFGHYRQIYNKKACFEFDRSFRVSLDHDQVFFCKKIFLAENESKTFDINFALCDFNESF